MECKHPEPRAYCKREDGCHDCDEQPAGAHEIGLTEEGGAV